MKSNKDFRNALGQPDEYFEQAVLDTLDQLNRQEKRESRPHRNYIPRIACTFAALVLVIAGVVLSVRQTADGHVDNIRPIPAAMPAALPDTFSSMEMGLVDIRLLNTETDGHGIFLSFEVTPKRENILIINSLSFDPVANGPAAIGLTADREGQNILQWAAEHDCEILEMEIFSPIGEPTCDASFSSDISSPALGKPVILNVFGCSLPDVSLYRLTCWYFPFDLSNPLIYEAEADSIFDEVFNNTRLLNPAVISSFTVSVTGERETPEILAEYRLDSGNTANAQSPDISVTCFRTSLAVYLDICTGINNDDVCAVKANSSLRCFCDYDTSTSVHGYVRQEDGTILLRMSVNLTGDFPDSFMIGFMPYYYDDDTREWGPGYPMKRVK